MSEATRSITIGRTIDDVFRVTTDPEKTGLWFPGDVSEQWTSPPPHGVGSTRHAVITVLGWRTENDAVTTEYEPPHRAAMRGTSPNAPFSALLTFKPDGESTRVVVVTEIALRGPARLMAPLAAAVYGWVLGRGLRKLKELMEAGRL